MVKKVLSDLGYKQVEDNCVYTKEYDCGAEIVIRFKWYDLKDLDEKNSYVLLDNIGITSFDTIEEIKEVLVDFHKHMKIIKEVK